MLHIPIGREINFSPTSFPKRVAYDNEVYPNFFSCAVADIDSNGVVLYEISERKNDIKKLKNDFRRFKYAVSWNGVHYDSVVLMKLFEYYDKNPKASYKELTKQAYYVSSSIIDFEERIYVKPPWKEIDLFLYWSQLIRKAKKLSLKSMANFIRWPWIQELPIAPGTKIKKEQIDELLSYNVNDALITRELAVNQMSKDIQFRFSVEKEYGIRALSSDGVKIGMDYLKQLYAKKLGISVYDIPRQGTERDKIDIDSILFHNRFEASTPQLKKIYEKYCNTVFVPNSSNPSHKLILPQKWEGRDDNLVATLGMGGIHTEDKPNYLFPPKGYVYIASDVKSYYPNLFFGNMLCPAHLDIAFTLIYRDELYPSKDSNKKLMKENKKLWEETGNKQYYNAMVYYSYATILSKLALNGFTGNLRNPYSWVRDDAVNLAITINGQLLLAMLAEWCIARGWRVVSMNTDGIEIMLPEKDIDEYMALCKKWDKQCNVELEHDFYSRVFRTSVNDYIAVNINGSIKGKGDFELYKDMPLDKSPEYMAIPNAIHEYVKNGTSIQESIYQNNDIFDFCAFPKPAKKYKVFWGSEEVNRLNRFYLSKRGKYLMKWNTENGAKSSIVAKYGVKLYNHHRDDYDFSSLDVDKTWYIKKAQNIIDSVTVKQKTLF